MYLKKVFLNGTIYIFNIKNETNKRKNSAICFNQSWKMHSFVVEDGNLCGMFQFPVYVQIVC